MLPVTNSRGKFISVLDLEGQFEWIKADAKHGDGKKSLNRIFKLSVNESEKKIAVNSLLQITHVHF